MVPRTHLSHAAHKTPLVAERRAWFHHGSVVVPGTHLSHAAQKTLFNAIACRATAWLRYGSVMAPLWFRKPARTMPRIKCHWLLSGERGSIMAPAWFLEPTYNMPHRKRN